MTHTPHELAAEFPDLADRIAELKASDPHFARLAESYHDLNRAVHRAETDVEPVDDLQAQRMRKERAALKDDLYRMLKG